ncbi:MAG: hypothetical protein II574_03820, partial [Ruminococcus sp.]|nr:hypothetical protein [Ruminococcus sp.]
MKKTLTVLLAAAMMLAAAGCSKGSEEYSIPELKEVPKVTEKYDSSAVNTDMFAREGEFFLPSGEKGKELFTCDSEVPLKKDTVKTKIRKVYEQDGMLVVEIEARSGYEKTLTSVSDLEYTITDKNDNLIAHYTFEYLRDEKGKIVKLAPERTVDAMLVFPAGSYTTKGVDFSTLSWHSSSNVNDDDDSSKASTSRTDTSGSDSAVRLPSGAKGDLLFSCKDAYTRVKDNLEFQVRYIY